jgi:hypothetical protein
VTRRGNRFEWVGLVLVVLGLALLAVYWPAGVGALALAGLCLVGAVRGWRFPGTPRPPDPMEGLSRKARRHVEVDPEWSVDFLEPAVTHGVPEVVPFSGIEPRPTLIGTIPLRNAQRRPGIDLPGIGAELTFFREGGRLVYERVSARWSNSPLPQVRRQLEPDQRLLPASGEPEPIDVAARVDDESAAFVRTADAMRGGKQLRLDPEQYYVRVWITGAADDPVGWYRLQIPLMKGLELRGPVDAPRWAPPEAPRPVAPGPRVVPRKRSGSQPV